MVEIAPALRETLQRGGTPEILRAALIAYARLEASGGGTSVPVLCMLADSLLASESPSAAEAAVVALGIQGSGYSASLLIDLLLDTEAGRSAAGKVSVDWRMRSFAAYALALIGERSAGPALRRDIAIAFIRALDANASAPHDTQIACLIGMGLVPMEMCELPVNVQSEKPLAEHFCRGRQISQLLDVLVDPRRHPRLRAHAAVPAARLAAGTLEEYRRSVAEDLMSHLGPRSRAPSEIQQGCVIALGLLGGTSDSTLDQEIRAALEREEASGDDLCQRLALVSLARVAAREGSEPGGGRSSASRRLQERLLERMRRTDRLRGWAAVSLGILGRSLGSAGRPADPELADALRAQLSTSRAPADLAACSLALGLLRDESAGERVLRRVEHGKDAFERSCAALALGLLDARSGAEPLRALFRPATDARLLREASTALRLMEDVAAAPGICSTLDQAADVGARVRLCSALGQVGGAHAVRKLSTLLRDAQQPAPVRAAAAAALGELVDPRRQAWSVSISTDLLYPSLASTLVSFASDGSGILEMR